MTQEVPQVVFKTRVRDESIGGDNPFRWQDVSTDDIFKGNLPGYEAKYQDFKDAGVDEVYCLSVNDAFSMYQWGKQLGVQNVKLLPDGNADFTRGMDMLVKKENLGFGDRSWRYSMLVEDGKVTKIFAEDGKEDNCPTDPFECSDCDTMLNFIKSAA